MQLQCDYTERNLGSVVNSFGVPSRYDGDTAYISPRIAGVQVVAHYAIGGGGQQNTSTFNQGVFQLRADYVTGPFRVAYSGLVAKAANGAVHGNPVFYHSAYANYDYGLGTIYAAYIHSNNGGGARRQQHRRQRDPGQHPHGYCAGTNADRERHGLRHLPGLGRLPRDVDAAIGRPVRQDQGHRRAASGSADRACAVGALLARLLQANDACYGAPRHDSTTTRPARSAWPARPA